LFNAGLSLEKYWPRGQDIKIRAHLNKMSNFKLQCFPMYKLTLGKHWCQICLDNLVVEGVHL